MCNTNNDLPSAWLAYYNRAYLFFQLSCLPYSAISSQQSTHAIFLFISCTPPFYIFHLL